MRIQRSASTLVIALFVSWWAFTAEAAEAQQYSIGPPAEWIERVVPAISPSKSREASSGVEDLLLDRQVRVDAGGAESYFRFAQYVVSEAGVAGVSAITLNFDPHSDRITLHDVTVRRQGVQIDQLNSAQINVLRREDRLEQGLLDGDLTLSIVLADIRVGDIVEYSLTNHHFDPAMGTRFYDSFITEWSTPTRWSRLRLMHPSARNIVTKQIGVELQPQHKRAGGWDELIWEWRNLAGRPSESERPSWHRQYPRIYMSEWRSWSDVVDWAVELYRPGNLSPEMHELVREWENTGATSAERIVLALRFVQDQVRYTGIEIGAGAYAPTDSARVLQRRFGDCKDKVMLLVSLLRAMNIDADPALVDTELQHRLSDILPAPRVFDHAIVRVRNEGTEYWFDATRSLQGGTLDTIEQAHLGAALVIESDADDLQTIPPAPTDTVTTDVREAFDVSAGIDKKGTLQVTTAYVGSAADDLRHELQESTLDEIGREYLNYYRDWYPTIEQSAPLEVKDERDANRIEVIEHYEFDPAFEKQDDGEVSFAINPHVVMSRLNAPQLIQRSTPLQLTYPDHVRYATSVLLPSRWTIKNEDVEIADPAFVYSSRIKSNGRKFDAVYEYRSFTNHVDADRVPEFARNLARAKDDGGYWFNENSGPKPFSLARLNLAAVVALVLGILVGIAWVRRFQRRPGHVRIAPAGAPVGIRGWLLLPALQTCLVPIALGTLLYFYKPYLNLDEWNALGSSQSDLLAQLLKLAKFSLIFLACALSTASSYAVFALFTRRRTFPIIYIQLTVVMIVFGLIDLVVSIADPTQTNGAVPLIGAFIRDTVLAGIWIAYMLRSKRVAATFVSESRRRVVPALAPSEVSA